AESDGFTVYCMTPDKDFAQLVSENILLYRPARMGNGAEVHGVKEVLEKWEVERIEQVIDILGLWGDAVDNIPGIPGIGEKTAKKLIQQYGSIEEIIKNSHELKGKQRENIENFAEQGLISKKLATILLDVPIDFDEQSLRLEEPNREVLERLFAELEFRTIGKRVFGEDFNVNDARLSEGTQIDLFSQPQSQSRIQNSTQITEPVLEAGKNIDNSEHDYKTAQTPEEIQELVTYLSQQKSICFDTETTNIDANCCDLVGLSFSVEVGKAWYVPVSENREECLKVVNLFKPIFEDENIEKVGQNLKYDILVLNWYGIEVKGKLFDTMLAHYLLDADSRHSMDVMAESFLGYSPIPITKLIGAKGKKQGNMREVAIEDVAPYACEDADITLQLKEVFLPMLEAAEALPLANDVEFPLIYVLA